MIVAWLFVITGTLAIDHGNCARNQTILETSGDAILTVFIDLFQGQSCNESSPRGFQELATSLYVTSTLNKLAFTQGLSLGLKIVNTCQDSTTAAVESLQTLVSCPDTYSLGLLAPLHYLEPLEPISKLLNLPLTLYSSPFLPKISLTLDFLASNFPMVDLLLTESSSSLNLFLNLSQPLNLCIRSFTDLSKLEDSTEALIVLSGSESFIRSRIPYKNPSKTLILVPLDDSDLSPLLPPGSYLLAPESFTFQPEDSESPADQIRIPVPVLLSLAQPIISIAELLSSLQEPNCTSSCPQPPFDASLAPPVSSSRALKLLNFESRTQKFTFYLKSDSNDTLQEISSYEVDDLLQFQPLNQGTGGTGSKNRNRTFCGASGHSCCINKAKSGPAAPVPPKYEVFVLIDAWGIIFLILAAFGTVVCLLIGLFVLYRAIVDEFLDGNPVLTFVLILGTISTLGSVVVFCLGDNHDQEFVNKWKIFSATASTGFVFALMLARSFFLAFSTKGVFSSHINGFLQALMVFFVNAVQLAVSVVFFFVNETRSQEVLSSYQFVALSGYNIFQLLAILVMSSVIFRIPRNYKEGRCFLYTSLGLSGIWSIWILSFFLVPPTWREIIIALSLIGTSYALISGLILKVFYILTHLDRQNDIRSPFENAEFRSEPRRRSFRQVLASDSRRPFHDYVLPMEGVRNQTRPNYYGNSSPSERNPTRGDTCGPPTQPQSSRDRQGNVKSIGFNNYGFADMQETENHYVVPRVCVQNPDNRKKGVKVEVNYAQPNYEGHNYPENYQKSHRFDNDNNDECLETEIYVEGKRLSPTRKNPNEAYPSRCSSPRLYQTEATIDEEDESNEESSRVTRF